MKWFVFKTSDEAGNLVLREAEFESQIDAMAEMYTLATIEGRATINYKRHLLYELFSVTPEKGDPFFLFIAGRYD